MSTPPLQPLVKIQRAIQLAGFHYIASLKARPTNADYTITFSEKEYSFHGIKSSNNQQLHADFQGWASASVIRDLIESFSIFLMEIYDRAVATNPNGVFSSTPSKFEQRGIEDQPSNNQFITIGRVFSANYAAPMSQTISSFIIRC